MYQADLYIQNERGARNIFSFWCRLCLDNYGVCEIILKDFYFDFVSLQTLSLVSQSIPVHLPELAVC